MSLRRWKRQSFKAFPILFCASIIANSFCFSMLMAAPARAAENTVMPDMAGCASVGASATSLRTDHGQPGIAECCVSRSSYFQTARNITDNFRFIPDSQAFFETKTWQSAEAICAYPDHPYISPPPQAAAIAAIVKRE